MNQTRVQTGLAFALCMICYLFGGTVSTLMSVNLPVAVPDLMGKALTEAETGRVGAFLNAAFIFGWMAGGLTLGLAGDRFGRVKTLAFSAALYGFFTLLTVWVQSWQALLFYRFFVGVGVGGVLLASTVYISEIWKENTRPVALGILAVSFPVGIVITGGLNVLFSQWRASFWLGLIPMTFAVLVLLFLNESPRWKEMHAAGVSKTRKEGFSEGSKKNLLIGSLIFGSVLVGLWAIFSWLPTWVQSLLPAGQDGQKERGITMMLLGIGGIVGGMFSGFLVRKAGTRKTLIFTFTGCFSACLLLFLTNRVFSPVIYLEMALLSLFFGISQGSLSSIIPELFPVSIRATATGFCFNIGRFFTATAVFFVGSLVAFFGNFGNALLSFSMTFLVALVTVILAKFRRAE